MRMIYCNLMVKVSPLFGTRLEEIKWITRKLDRSKIKGEWHVINSHRRFLMKQIDTFIHSSINSIIELGCGIGINLFLLAKKFPYVKMIGIDINSSAIRIGNELLKQEGITNVKLIIGKVEELLPLLKDKSFDITLTDAFLMYIAPDKFTKILKDIIRITRKAIILSEWFAPNVRYMYDRHWVRDYVAMLKEFIPNGSIQIIKYPENCWEDEKWRKYGYLIIATFD